MIQVRHFWAVTDRTAPANSADLNLTLATHFADGGTFDKIYGQ